VLFLQAWSIRQWLPHCPQLAQLDVLSAQMPLQHDWLSWHWKLHAPQWFQLWFMSTHKLPLQ
jgi:hypothetical protein